MKLVAHPCNAVAVPRRATVMAALVVVLSAGLVLPLGSAQAATRAPLGTAENFAILAGSTITNTGPTTVTGDVGLHPGTAVTGFGPGADAVTLNGSLHVADGVALQAKNDLANAYTDAAGQTPVTEVPTELGGTTLNAGVYDSAAGTFGLTGSLTLDGQGDPDAVFIFQMDSTLTTASNSAVSLINGADACNVFWQVGSSATLGTGTSFAGSILALTSITLTTGATVQGRVLARNGAVTLDTNVITNAECAAPVAETPVDETPVDETPVDETPVDETPVDSPVDTPDGDASGGDTTGQVREVPSGSVAAGGGVVDASSSGSLLPLIAMLLVVLFGGILRITARRRTET